MCVCVCVCVCDGSRLVTVVRPSRISSSRSRSRISGWRRHGIQPTVSTTPYVDRVPLSAITVTGLLPRRRRRHDTTSLGCNLLLRQSSCRLLMLVNWINQMSFALRTSRTLLRTALSAPASTYCSAQSIWTKICSVFLVANESKWTFPRIRIANTYINNNITITTKSNKLY